MIKKAISLTEPQVEWLEKESQRLGISLPELVRCVVDQIRSAEQKRPEKKDEQEKTI